MKCFVSFVCVLSVILAVGIAAPAPQLGASTGLQVGASVSASAGGGAGGNPITNILSNIDLPGLLRGVNSFVGLVRQLCPPAGQILDNVIQNVTSTAFRVFGRAILQMGGLGGGGGGSGGGSSGGSRVSVVLPTFPPDEDYDEEDYDDSSGPLPAVGDSSSSSANAIPLAATNSTTAGTTSTTTSSSVSSANEKDNLVEKRHVRVPREVQDEELEEDEEDQDGAESAPQPQEDSQDEDDQDRNKRFSPFGAGGAAGGSGNFLFDIIRNTAQGAGKAAAAVSRMVQGVQNLGWGLTTTAETTKTLTPATGTAVKNNAGPREREWSNLSALVAGSGATEEGDEAANSPGGVAQLDITGKGHAGYQETIPGPITRLFVIANRGIANLMQDLILRLAQTSEKFVNFKARLVTSLI